MLLEVQCIKVLLQEDCKFVILTKATFFSTVDIQLVVVIYLSFFLLSLIRLKSCKI